MTILIPDEMKEAWNKFAEAVINSKMGSEIYSLSNTIKMEDKLIYLELKITASTGSEKKEKEK